ncbi:DDB1- and CUL4-associated factor 5-like [Tetranychus urticae]|uniref:Uncharacterized protein n=1 Tax=Tetranychus urticae TaxID=32264 RepID=T1KL63_TETUR|nr:DDB1- and CUL4-associated factor 5-like [Tetranychus urticae]
MATTGITHSLIANNFGGPVKDVHNSVSALTAREYGYTSNLSVAQNQTIDYLIRARYRKATGLYSKDLYAHYGCINAIEFSNNGQLMVSGGDDRRVLLWNVEKALSDKDKPIVMKAEHTSNIFCLGLDSDNRHIFSGGNDEQVIIHDVETREPLKVILHREVVYCLSVDPQNDNLFATACDEGRIFLFDLRVPYNMDNLPVLIHTRSAFQSVMHNPVEPRLIVTANSREGVSLWDIRKPRVDLIKYNGGLVTSQSAMSVRFNSNGSKIVALRRRLPVILYNTLSPHPIAEFDDKDYYNSCTMKSCCFAGSKDEYILSGSDDFRLYMWKIPDEILEKDFSSDGIKWVDQTHLILRGHRSIVNQVRYNYSNSTIASSGVEKVIKVWSIFDIFDPKESDPKNTCSLDDRKVYSHEEYIQLVLESGHLAAHDYSNQSVQEDPRMIAFFDSLVQRDIEGLTTDSNSEDSDFASRFSLITRNHARIESLSELSSSDEEKELLHLCDDQIVGYIKSFSERMESSVNRLYGTDSKSSAVVPNSKNADSSKSDSNNAVNDNQNSNDVLCKPSTSSARPSSSSLATSSSSLSASRSQATDSNNDNIDVDANKISILINEKKKEQLRKATRYALKSTKIRLRRLKKHLARDKEEKSKACDKTSGLSIEDKERRKEQLEGVLEILERLAQKVDNGLKNNRGHLHKMMVRLRYLANRNNFLWRGGSPESPLGFDSDDDPPLIGGNDLLNEVRMAHRLADLLTDGIVEHLSLEDDDDEDSLVEDRSISTDSTCGSDGEKSASNSTDTSISQIKSPDTNRSQTKSPDSNRSQIKSPDSSTSSSSDEDLNKRQRRRKASERRRNLNKKCVSNKYVDSSSSSSSSSSSDNDSEAEEPEKRILPMVNLRYDEESDDAGFDGDTESAKKKSANGAVKSKAPISNNNSQETASTSANDQLKDLSSNHDDEKSDDINNNKNLNSDTKEKDHQNHESGQPSKVNNVTIKTVNNTGKCFRKRKNLESNSEKVVYKSIKRKHD